MRSLGVAVLAAGLLALPLPARAARVEPTEAALKAVEKLRARSMGVDRAGNLWAWEPQSQRVVFLSPTGERVGSIAVPDARSLDADAEWGVVALVRDGSVLHWFRGGKGEDLQLPLDGLAAEVCWVGPATVAITPQTAAYRVGIWNLNDRALIKTFGQETVLHPTFGATRMRAVLMRYDFERGLLYTLESYLGDLQVYTLEGKLSWRVAVDNPLRADDEKWLSEIDLKAKEQKDIQTPLVHYFYLGLARNGEAWVVRSGSQEAQSLSLARLSPGGVTERKLENQQCVSRSLTFWGDWLIVFTDPASARVCSQGRRFL